MKNLINPDEQGAHATVREFHSNWARAAAGLPKRISVHVADISDAVPCQHEVSRAFDEAPHVAIARTPVVSAFNEKVQVDSPSPDDVITWDEVALSSIHSCLLRGPSRNHPAVWEPCAASWVTIFGKPRCVQVDAGGDGRMRFGRSPHVDARASEWFGPRIFSLRTACGWSYDGPGHFD